MNPLLIPLWREERARFHLWGLQAGLAPLLLGCCLDVNRLVLCGVSASSLAPQLSAEVLLGGRPGDLGSHEGAHVHGTGPPWEHGEEDAPGAASESHIQAPVSGFTSAARHFRDSTLQQLWGSVIDPPFKEEETEDSSN